MEDLGRTSRRLLRRFAMQESVWLIRRLSMGPLDPEAVRSQAQMSPQGDAVLKGEVGAELSAPLGTVGQLGDKVE